MYFPILAGVLLLLANGCSREGGILAPDPTPTRRPKPTPTPKPTSTPVPTPTPTYYEANLQTFLERHRREKASALKEYEQNAEKLDLIGEAVELRLLNGEVAEGNLLYVYDNRLSINTKDGSRIVLLSELDSATRYMVDSRFRKEVSRHAAALEALRNVSEDFDLSRLELDKRLSEEDQLELGLKPALLRLANAEKAEGRSEKAYFLYQMLAEAEVPEAVRELALLYFQGGVVPRSPETGAALLRRGTELGDPESVELWRQYQERQQALRKAQETASRPPPARPMKWIACPHCGGKGYRTSSFGHDKEGKLPCVCGGSGRTLSF